jgi:pimeloyl-ACP methyl ester carboxylesterase
MNFGVLRAILAKDLRSLLPLVMAVAAVFIGDVFVMQFELIAQWPAYRTGILPLAATVLVLAVIQLDAPASLVDDWLCRPVPRAELLAAKLVLLFSVFYLSRVVATLAGDLILGRSPVESLQEALLLQDEFFLLLLPILLIIAVVTQTLVQGFGVLFALLICVFVLPSPFLRDPGPLDPGIGDGMYESGMGWLTLGPTKIGAALLAAFTLWLVYWRRRITWARIMVPVATLIVVLLAVTPMYLAPWQMMYRLQARVVPAQPGTDFANLRLRNANACFKAARVVDLYADPTFKWEHPFGGILQWRESALKDPGPDAIAFITHFDLVGVPADWRSELLHVRADYQGLNGSTEHISLRPVSYINRRHRGESLWHTWALPGDELRALKASEPTLRLEYSLALGEPTAHSLPTDGKRHALPGLGYCSAEVDAAANHIEVDCFSSFGRPEQLSAELDEIPASRVYATPDLSPRWMRWMRTHRAKLEIASPRLAKHDTITVTAWRLAGYLQKEITLPGILGADLTTCPLPDSQAGRFQASRWRDAAPHEPYSIRVEEGVQLEVLDFGGTGSPIVLLPGLGATAHGYDLLAPELAKRHRVIAMTRRGTGASSKPDFGFDTARLGQDVLAVMDEMGLQKVLLVGSSIAGDELTWLGGHHPDRFSGLVYLDAAYDRSIDHKDPRMTRLRELNRLLPPDPPIPPEAMTNYDTMVKLMESNSHALYPEGELIALFGINHPVLAGTPSIDARTQQAISAAIQTPDYAALKIPALAIYAFEHPDWLLRPWHDRNDARLVATMQERARILDGLKRASIEQFRQGVARGQVIEMQNASHNVALSNPGEVLAAIEQFSAGNEGK